MLDEIFGIDENYVRDVNGWLECVHPDSRNEMARYLANDIMREKKYFDKEYKVLRKTDNTEIWVHGLGSLESDSEGNLVKMFGTIQDITEKKNARDIIENSLREKEVLLKEIHHRVKNNFQKIISLISLQEELITDQKVTSIFHDLQTRLRSMSLIHELMYGSGNFAAINFKDYVEHLTRYLFRTYSTSDRIKLNLDLENHNLDLESIIPCGLIINEVLTNSFKYAFPSEMDGNINISFGKVNDEYRLEISDDGVGVENKIDFENVNSLGLRLINLFTKQLKGSMEIIQHRNGLKFVFKFKGGSQIDGSATS